MFRIDTLHEDPTRVDIRLSGRLADIEVDHVASVVESQVALKKAVQLDLSGLTGVDRCGVGVLLRFSGEGVVLVNCPAFLTLWLRAEHDLRIHGIS